MKILFTAFLAVFLCAMSTEAIAQNVCGPHEEITKRLETGYQEKRIGVGLAGNGTLVELFRSEEKGTWTFMYTRPDGVSCLMAAGADWEVLDDPAAQNEDLKS